MFDRNHQLCRWVERPGKVFHEGAAFFFSLILKRFQGDWLHWRLQDRRSIISSPIARAKSLPSQHFALNEPEGNDLEDAGFAIHETNSKVICDSPNTLHYVNLFTFIYIYVLFSQSNCKHLMDRYFFYEHNALSLRALNKVLLNYWVCISWQLSLDHMNGWMWEGWRGLTK